MKLEGVEQLGVGIKVDLLSLYYNFMRLYSVMLIQDDSRLVTQFFLHLAEFVLSYYDAEIPALYFDDVQFQLVFYLGEM